MLYVMRGERFLWKLHDDFKDFYNYLDFLYPDFEVINSHEKAKIEASFNNGILSVGNFRAFSDSSSFSIAGFADFKKRSIDGRLSKDNNLEAVQKIKKTQKNSVKKLLIWKNIRDKESKS